MELTRALSIVYDLANEAAFDPKDLNVLNEDELSQMAAEQQEALEKINKILVFLRE